MKPFKFILLAAAVLCGLLTAINYASAQTWTQTSAGTNWWGCVASSADGNTLAAGLSLAEPSGPGHVKFPYEISTNSGVDWSWNTNETSGGTSFTAIASSADGSKLVAATKNGGVWTSTDYGNTWTSNNVPATNWQSVASSADGNNLVAVVHVGGIYTSPNSGNIWTQTSAPANGWDSVASSADGTKLVAASGFGYIYTSNDSGNTWISNNAPNKFWQTVASSADGIKLVAVYLGNGFYTSTNSGNTWTSINVPVPNGGFTSVASSADGTKLIAAGSLVNSQGPIYISTNSGNTWAPSSASNLGWSSVATSADGNKLVAVVLNGGIWTSQTTPTPQLNIVPSNPNLELSWLVPSTNFVLQQSPDLSSWTDVTDTPTLNLTNLQDEVVLSPTNSSGFYRLATP